MHNEHNVTAWGPTRLVRILLSRQTQRDGAHSALSPFWPINGMGRQVCARSSLQSRNKEHISRSGQWYKVMLIIFNVLNCGV